MTWTPTASIGLPNSFATYNDLAIDPAVARLFLATSNGLFRSGDGGENWIPVDGVLPIVIAAVLFDDADARLVIGTSRGISYAPAPGVSPWTAAELRDRATNIVNVVVDPRDPATIYASTADASPPGQQFGRIFASHDFGASWDEVPHAPLGAAPVVVFAPSNPNIAYKIESLSSFVPSALFVSEDAGRSWIRLRHPAELDSAVRVAVDPHDENRLFIATAGAVLRSTDRAVTWAKLGDGLPPLPPSAMVIDAAGLYLHVGLQNGAVWDLPLRAARGRAVGR
jgi:photosystem II stability/assembly factor-like uncharacterized protein